MRTSIGGVNRIYLDHNATTPLDPAVHAAMVPYMLGMFGNPSSVETEDGRAAAAAVDKAREQVAATIGARPNEIVFTGSCTEADNMAILGVARAHPDKRHIVTTRIEHPAVLQPARALEADGWRVTYLDVDETGLVKPEFVAAAIGNETSLVSVMGANNEVGAIQPLAAIGVVCETRGVLFHSDLAQLVAYADVDVERDHIHLASLSAHKAYGPKGVGALYVRSRRPRAKIVPIMFGGGQERGLRPGTVPTPLVVGMGEAFTLAKHHQLRDAQRLSAMCARFLDAVITTLPDAVLNGPVGARLANNVSLSIPNVEPLALMRRLSAKISFSASSACSTGKVETSPVLKAMFGEGWRARQAFRIAPGRFTDAADMDVAAAILIEAAGELRDVSIAAA